MSPIVPSVLLYYVILLSRFILIRFGLRARITYKINILHSFLDPDGGSQKVTVVVLLGVVITSLKVLRLSLIRSRAQRNFACTQADTSLRSVSSCPCLLSPLRGCVSVLAHAAPRPCVHSCKPRQRYRRTELFCNIRFVLTFSPDLPSQIFHLFSN